MMDSVKRLLKSNANIKLMKRGFPVALLVLLEKWFEMSVTCVRWHGHDTILNFLD